MATYTQKTFIYTFLTSLILAILVNPSYSFANHNNPHPFFKVIGNIKNHTLLNLLKKHNPTRVKKEATTALLLDGSCCKPSQLKNDPGIKKAIRDSTPIVISNPTSEEIRAITGVSIQSDLAIITPKNEGNEFEINMTPPNETINPAPIRSTKQEAEQIWKVLDTQSEEKCVNKDGEEIPCSNLHKRWTVKYINSFCWGKQGQFIDVGFQYDLYYVTDPTPNRKYLTVRTVGKGVSPGFLKHNSSFHRGYFQSEINVSISNSPHKNWLGIPLQVDELAPESDNRSNTVTTTTGITFSTALSTGVTLQPIFGFGTAGQSTGLSVTRSIGKSSTFKDYTITLESTPTIDKWSYWLSGADGNNIRRKEKHDTMSTFISNIHELPELAKSVIRPHMEAVYYAQGDETGTITMIGKVEQNLVDVNSFLITKYGSKIKKRKAVVDLPIDIDFSQVYKTKIIPAEPNRMHMNY